MSTITPPLPPQPPTVTPTPAPVLTVPNPPVELARLTIGGVLEAIVVSQPGKGTYLLQTPIGQLSVLSSVVLPKDASLALQVLSFSPQALLQLNTINGALPAVALRAGTSAGPPSAEQNLVGSNGVSSGGNKVAPLPSLLAGTVIKASLVRPLSVPGSGPVTNSPQIPGRAAPSAAPLSAPASVTPSPGAPPSVTGRPPLATSPGAVGAGKPSLQASPPSAGKATPTATPNVAAPPLGRPSGIVFPAGTQVSFKIMDVQPFSPVTNNITSPLSASGSAVLGVGRTLTGIVTGTTAAGHPVVQTEAGTFSLNAKSSAPRGSTVTLEVTTAPKPPPPTANPSSHPGAENSNIFSDRRWPPLEEALQVVRDANPAASHQFLNTVMPRPDAQLTAGLVFFLSALRGGDLRPWLGESNMRILERSRPNLASRLSNDFNLLGKIADEPVGADWRVAMIPINTGVGIEQIRMLIRHHGNDEKDQESADQGTRFILDVDLSRLGRIQLDGLVRDKGSKLDLIIRSGNTFDDESRNEIRKIFIEAGDLTGIRGSVSFQASPPEYIEVPDPLTDKKIGLIV